MIFKDGARYFTTKVKADEDAAKAEAKLQGEGCVDLHLGCPAWSEKCTTDKTGWLAANCMKTCDECTA